MLNLNAFCFLITTVIFSCGVSAQGINDPMFDQKDLSQLGVNAVHNILWDENDKMWCATEKGLVGYNGNSTELYDEHSTPSLLSNKVLNLVSDGPLIWISYSDSVGVSQLNTKTGRIEHFTDKSLIPDALVANIIPFKDDQVIICSWGDGFSVLDHKKRSARHYNRKDENDTTDVLCNRIKDITVLNDEQWLITYFESRKYKSTPTLYNPVKEEFTSYPIERFMKGYSEKRKFNIRKNLEVVNFSRQDHRGNLWIGSYSSLIFINQRDSSVKRIVIDSTTCYDRNIVNARACNIDKNNRLWVSTFNSGVLFVNISDQSAKYLRHDPDNLNSVATNQTGRIVNDPMGNVWVLSGGTHASVYNPYLQNFELHNWEDLPLTYSDRSAQNIPVEQLNVLDDGTIYLSDGLGLLRYNPYKQTYERTSTINKGGDKEYILRNGMEKFIATPQYLYFSNLHGFNKIERKTERHVKISGDHYLRPLFTHNYVSDTLYFYKGWRGNGGFYGYSQSSNEVFRCGELPEEGRLVYRANTVLSDGRWLLNTDESGFMVYDPSDNSEVNYHRRDSSHFFPDKTLNCSFVDPNKGVVWLGAASGIYQFNWSTGELQFFGDKIGTGDRSVNAIVKADDGVLWLGMNEQLFRWDEQNESAYSYTRQFGLRSGSFLPAYAQKDDSGRLYFVARNGLLSFDPESLEFSDNEFVIALDEITLRDTAFQGESMESINGRNDYIQLDWTQDEVAFSFAHNQFYAPTDLKFFYRLKGGQQDWIENGNSNEIRFAGLNYGRYELEVKAIDSYNQETEVRHLQFEITPPFWETGWFYVVVLVVSVIGVFVIIKVRERRLRNRQHKLEETVSLRTREVVQKADEIKTQKDVIELKNQELTASITYAKRIQDAILPSMAKMNHLLNEAFVYYRPKEIVAGDFYWVQQGDEHGQTVFFAVADCTGHGVPGAIVSVICNNALQRSLREFQCYSPSQLLNTTRDLVVAEFEKSAEGVKDGMDIALCKLIKHAPDQYGLEFAGANNPLIVIRERSPGSETLIAEDDHGGERKIEANKTTESHVLFEIKGDKQPIGSHFDSQPFTNHRVQLKRGDVVYLFSDGFHDQFGSFGELTNPHGKKLKTGNFKKLLLEAQSLTFDKQVGYLDKAFVDWKGALEQIDDVCVFGFKMTD